MEVYCNSTAQSEITEMTSKLKQFAALVELYRDDMTDKDMFMSELSYFESVDWTKENYFNQLLAYTALGSAYGFLKSKNLDYTLAYYDNEYVYKEISYYHNVHYIVSRVSNEQWAALYISATKTSCRAFLCLANAYDHLGRFCEAQQFYRLANLDDANQKDVEINQGYSYANMHSFYTEEEPWIVRKAQALLKKYPQEYDRTTPGLRRIVCSWKAPSFDVPQEDFLGMNEGAYEFWVNKNYLRFNRFNDVDPFSKLSIADNVKLQHINDTEENMQFYESSFGEIKRTFIETRKLLYTSIGGDGVVNIELLKMTYKNFYSILDKIALFLKAYLDLPIEVYRVDFSTMWTDKRNNIRPEILAHPQNLSLLALYNIKLDVYGSKSFNYVMDEQTKNLQRIRNFIEHKVIVIKDGPMCYDDYQLTISKEELGLDTIRLAQLVRCAIIYLCNFVMHAEYDKTEGRK